MATMLQLVQRAMGELGLSVPNVVAGNATVDVSQMLALLNALGEELQRMHEWQKLTKEYRFTTQFLATTGNTTTNSPVVTAMGSTTGLDNTYMVTGLGVQQDAYVLTNDSATQVTLTRPVTSTATGVDLVFTKTKYAFPDDFDRLINRTQWDKTNHWEMIGPESAQQWQWLKSGYIQTTPRVRYRQLGNFFQIWPPVGVANYYGFEYISNGWVLDASGNAKSRFTADDDTCIFPDRLMVLGLKLKYFEIKNFDTTALYRDFVYQFDITRGTDSAAPTLNLAPMRENLLLGYDSIPDSGYGR